MRRREIRSAAVLFAAGLVVMMLPATVQALDYTFDNWTGNELYNDFNNWTPVSVPGSGDTAIFDDTALVNPLTGPITVDDGTETGVLRVVENSNVEFSVTGEFDLTDTSNPSLVVGDTLGDNATMSLSQGRLDSQVARIGNGGGSQGKLTILNGALWVPWGVFIAYAPGSQGTLDMVGVGTSAGPHGDLEVGDGGTGYLNVTGGAHLDSQIDGPSGRDVIGDDLGSVGVATVRDSGSQWQTNKLVVGEQGNGTLWIENEGYVNSYQAVIQDDGGATGLVVVSGPNSLWRIYSPVNGYIDVGATSGTGSGTLRIQNEGRVEVPDQTTLNATGSILLAGGTFETGQFVRADPAGTFTWSSGTVRLTEQTLILDSDTPDSVFGHDLTIGAGKTLKVSWASGSGGIGVGRSGNGRLRIEDGGRVESYFGLVGDESFGSPGHGTVTVTGTGSSWINTTGLHLGIGGRGTLSIHDGAKVSSGNSTTIASGADSVATVTVDGAESRLEVGSTLYVSQGENSHGTLDVINGAQVTSANGYLGLGSNSTSLVTVEDASSRWTATGDLMVGQNTGTGSATLTIQDGGTTEVTGQTTINKTGTITVTDGTLKTGQLVKGDPLGTFTWNSGTVEIANQQLLLDDVTPDGVFGSSLTIGTGKSLKVTRSFTDTGSIAVGVTGTGLLMIEDGGSVENYNADVGGSQPGQVGLGTVTVRGTGSSWTTTEYLWIGNYETSEGTVSVENGGTVTTEYACLGVFNQSVGRLTVDGAGSRCVVTGLLQVGRFDNARGTLRITNGGQVNSGMTYIADLGDAIGLVEVEHADSLLTVTGNLLVGPNSGTGTGTLIVRDGGTTEVGGQTTINDLGSITLDNGTLKTGQLVKGNSGATLDWISGTLEITDQQVAFDAVAASPLGTDLVVAVGKTLEVSKLDSGNDGILIGATGPGSLMVQSGGTVEIAGRTLVGGDGDLMLYGGDFSTGSLEISGGRVLLTYPHQLSVATSPATFTTGAVDFIGNATLDGVFLDLLLGPGHILSTGRELRAPGAMTLDADLTLDGGNLAPDTLALGNGATLTAHGTVAAAVVGSPTGTITADNDLVLGNAARADGFHYEGTLNVGSHLVTLDSPNHAKLGHTTTINGGMLIAAGGVSLGPGDCLSGTGVVNAKVAADVGSTIEATGPLSLGDLGDVAGFASEGELHVRDNAVTIDDANMGELGTLTTVGVPGTQGTLEALNGLLVDFDSNLVGYGIIDTPDNPLTPLMVNGLVSGNSPTEMLTLNGYVKGVGTMRDVMIAGTLSPGFSPAEVDMIDVVLADTATLIMELGGTDPGSRYDVLNISEHIDLGGTLSVELISRFRPREGDSFDLFNFADYSGEFDAVSLPLLRPGLRWDDSQLLTHGTLMVVPEPGTLCLLAIAVLGLPAVMRRQRRPD